MEGVLISRLVTLLQQPGLMPDDMEEKRQKLLNLLMAIQPVLHDAQRRAGYHYVGPPFVSDAEVEVLSWLSHLKEVAYDADDILDGFRYVKLQAESATDAGCCQNGKKVSSGIPYCCKTSRMRFPFYKQWVGRGEQEICSVSRGERGLKDAFGIVVDKISDFVEKMITFNFEEGLQGIISDAERRQQIILSSPTEICAIVVGRDKEKEEIVQFLLNLPVHENLVRIVIVGDEGIGKRTLARYVYMDARVNNYFECIIWVDVLLEFKIGKIAKLIIDQAIGKDCCLSEDDTDLLKRRIDRELSGKRYLLVYNNISAEPQLLLELKSWLNREGGCGSSLIVLSTWYRKSELDLYFRPYICKLPALMLSELWELFCNNAFSNNIDTRYKTFENMGMKILCLCEGSPHLVSLMGGLMRFKKEPAEWLKVINQLENLACRDYSSIVKFCYNYMSSEAKQCFLFCYIFPFGYYMDKEVLIKLWMANDLFFSDGTTTPEEKGDILFNEIALRHFFEDIKLVQGDRDLYMNKHEYCSRVVCKIPPMIYRFCRYHAIKENILQLDEGTIDPWQTSQVCYLSMSGDSPIYLSTVLKFYPLVRTLMSAGDPFVRIVDCSALPKSNSLRALHLHSSLCEGNLLEVEHIKHLRYLDLSGSRIKILPESTCSLYNLQTLNLSKCLLLYQLPENMRHIRSLRHLYVHKCPMLKRMPPHLGKLINLRTLSSYIVGEHIGNGIDEIRDLNLGDLLELYNLYKVKDATEAKDANLISKNNLEILTLCWGSNQLVLSNKTNDLEVLEALEPHNGLKVLKVQEYGDSKFATWLTNPVGLHNLVELYLIGCSQCMTLPAVWKLPSLQVLCLKHMVSLTCICSFSNVDSEDSSQLFPSLKRMALIDLKRLEKWQEEETSLLELPQLSEMEITKCPNLRTIPQVPNIKHFTRSIENHMQLWSVIALIGKSESLLEANITKESSEDNEPFLSSGENVQLDDNHRLRIMRLDSINIFFMPRALPSSLLGFWRSLTSLESLDICNCKGLINWPLEEFRNLNKLKRLSFRTCPNLTGLYPSHLLESKEHFLPRLQTLEFYRCDSLKEVSKCCLILNLDECQKVQSISGMINLEVLYLSCTSWTSLPAGMGDLKKLVSFQVSECYSLTNFPDELAGLTLLQTLVINKCPRVKTLPNSLEDLQKLKSLRLSECSSLTCLPDELEGLTSLVTLVVNKCHGLKSLSNTLGILRNLEFLQVSECSSLACLPDGWSHIPLRTLIINKCPALRYLPNSIGKLNSLEFFKLSECSSLTCLPDELKDCRSLRTLIISKCSRVKSLPNLFSELLSGLDKFQILECPELERSCREGLYSYIISQIGTKKYWKNLFDDRMDSLSAVSSLSYEFNSGWAEEGKP